MKKKRRTFILVSLFSAYAKNMPEYEMPCCLLNVFLKWYKRYKYRIRNNILKMSIGLFSLKLIFM